MPMKATTEEIVKAYQEAGTVWAAGKRLGMAGQSVHERLVSIGYPMRGRRWTDEEFDELRNLAEEGVPLSEIARRLGRPYGSCAGQASRLRIRFGNKREKKIPRGAGYDKVSTKKHMKALKAYEGSVLQYARANGLHIDPLVKAIQRHHLDEWNEYVRTHSSLEERVCEYCESTFIPMSGKQRFCDRKCAADARQDAKYFGGKRKYAVGLSEGQCQLCQRKVDSHLAVHHVFGKENDPDDTVLIALCRGCHSIITLLGGRTFVNDPATWEALISLTWLRKNGSDSHEGHSLRVSVELEVGPEDEL